jgi:hypothetical protein
VNQNYFSYAIAFLNRRTDGTPSDVAVTLLELGLAFPGGYSVEVYNILTFSPRDIYIKFASRISLRKLATVFYPQKLKLKSRLTPPVSKKLNNEDAFLLFYFLKVLSS